MDSGNSGSIQSSSGDEEYDSSRAPGFLNINPPTHHFAPNSDSNPEPPNSLLSHFQNHQQPAFFDLSSNYYQALSQSQPNSNPNFLLNLDTSTLRSRGQRSDQPSCTDLGNLSSPPSSTLSILASQGPGGHASGPGPGPFSGPPSTMQLRQPVHSESSGPRGPAQTSTNVARNSKKRTRASRRAPTTVLTTDTTNFRAMVQEFTGIPAPPFSGSSYSRRFDLFGSGMRTAGHMDTMGPLYPLRPSAQKVQPSPFLSSSSPLLSNNMIEATNVATTSNNNFLSSSNYQPPSSSHHHHHQSLPKHVLNMQNPILSFHSLPSQPLHPSLSVQGFGSRPHQGTTLSMASMEELDMSRGFIDANHLDHGGVVGNDGGRQDLFRGLEGNSQPRVSSCKMNYAAASSTSEFHHPDKGLEMNIVSTRGTEGTVDSWICPSD